ncbi:Retrovirus-related Pol polyprotein from transposon TNT 1-94 [Gossypium australe]|uniref:Retrovirus-related Pol polyprotein from transposon TNT 1-94 n=1 Tax=Gossypium australe TaxID=47621 RepID=A0A5B6UTD0_9ROSI|nr:Retrovirus-related Pol polyprotein from transposon TNT 1-94 [Gossypium australe]
MIVVTTTTSTSLIPKREEDEEEATTLHLSEQSQQKKPDVECFWGHKYECRVNLNNENGDRTNFIENEKVSLLMACYVKEETQKNLWYLDIGCSNHMSHDKSAFSVLDESIRDNSVMGKGEVTIQMKINVVHTISNVLFVPDLKTNLLSIGQLQENGYKISINDVVCRIQYEKLGLIAQVDMTPNRMFPLYLHTVTNSCFLARLEDESWLWHFWYGHLNFGGLKILQQKNMMTGLPHIQTPSQVCEECVISKQHREPFQKGKSWKVRNALELVHSDLCGSIIPTSNRGKRYFISFIDDFSRKTWVYYLNEKSEALTAFKSFKALVEKEAETLIKVLRSDRGGEYN